ncbi:MAG: peptidoglycan DD-metalloendopeptidase family protein [Gammaproteobacteria bacterium]|nr:peptidoglycan DD-metalloendopeptidase family protein [Gammaproteobacteria bacterium]
MKSDPRSAERGLDITGQFGEAVSAAAAGQVVYSGGGLIGYGKLIIIKHSETYLSAYAHNSKLLVAEGDRVESGQQIAIMGRNSDGQATLHFEIRQNGTPVNPLNYLPNRQL